MKGDFTRMTFDFGKHYSRVLRQQGRVQLDADDNEATDIQLYLLRTLAADLIGPHGGPGDDFKLDAALDKKGQKAQKDFSVGSGHYYVNGILCENDGLQRYTQQRGFPSKDGGLGKEGLYLAYLDVWERHITELEDADVNRVGIREVALRGPDTATRSKVIWQVKTMPVTADQKTRLTSDKRAAYDVFHTLLGQYVPGIFGTAMMKARAIKPNADDEPCLISPKARYRGAENQLYRVEIHRPGVAWNKAQESKTKQPVGNNHTAATFKWSRENGSVIFGIQNVSGDVVTLENLGRDARFGLRPDDWVEVVDDDYVLQNRAEPLLQVKEIDREAHTVILKNGPSADVGRDPSKHPLLRRWDQRTGWFEEGALLVTEGTGDHESEWIELEDGVQIQFPPDPNNAYHTGDYWLIPARTATGDVEWPGPAGDPLLQRPNGVQHSYAPLGIVTLLPDGTIDNAITDLRRMFITLWT